MNYSYSNHNSINRNSLLYPAVVLVVLAFSVGFAAGSGGWTMPGGGMTPTGKAASEDGIDVFFSPKGGCTEAVIEEVNKAQKEIELQAYSFTSQSIVQAVINAHHRGVNVTIVLDKSNLKDRSDVEVVAADQIPTYIDSEHAIAHNKIILIDGQTIITGSFNFTQAAEHSNAENLLVLHNRPQLYAAYHNNFLRHKGHSEPYTQGTARETTSSGRFH